jgi:hypothetical protein
MTSKFARLWFAAALACAASPALADITWTVSGTFNDGGQLGGWFTLNVDNYLSDYDLTTTAGSIVTSGVEYTPANSYWWNGDFYLDVEPGDFGALNLAFADTLAVPEAHNALVTVDPGPPAPVVAQFPATFSYECVKSWSCYLATGGPTRYIADGFASAPGGAVPEPAAWALMIVGFGLAGGLLRTRRRAALA